VRQQNLYNKQRALCSQLRSKLMSLELRCSSCHLKRPSA